MPYNFSGRAFAMLTLLVCLFVSYFFPLGATQSIEDLKKAIASSKPEDRAILMIQASEALRKSDPKTAWEYATAAEKLALELYQDYQIGLARKEMGNIHYIRNEWSAALSHYQHALESAHTAADDALLGDLYYNMGRSQTHLKDYPSAYENHQKALTYRSMLTDKEDECTSYNSLGLLYWEQQDYPNARLYFRKAIALIDAKISARLAAGVYNNLGNVLLKTGETAAAGEAYIASLRIKESYGSTAELATANLNLGNMFFTTTDFPRALQFFQTALSLYQSTGDERNKGLVLANLGSTYNHLNDENRALKHHREALVIFQKFNMLENIGKTLNNIANTHTRQQRHDEALESYAKALALKKASNDTEGIATTLSNIGKAHIASEAWDEALASIKASNEYAQKIDAQLIILNNYKQLAKIYEAMGDYKKACEAYKMFIEKDLEIYEIAKKDVIAEMIVRFDTETKEREISELQTLQQAQQEKLQRQQWEQRIILFITLGVLLTALGLGLLYRAKQKEVQRRRSIQAELEDLNRELEDRIQKAIENYQRDQEIIARKSKLESLGTLSAGIAHEINQPLSAISMSIENIQHRMLLGSLNPEYLKGKCSKNMEDIERIRQIIQHVRLFSRDQKNGLIEQVDVNLVVKNAMELSMHDIRKNRIQPLLDLSEQTPMIVGNHFKLEQVLLNLISNAQDAILQKAQMASEPLDAYIRFVTRVVKDEVLISIEDNGIGIPAEIRDKLFDPFFTTKDPDKGTGLGLSISYGIVQEMSGEISLESETDRFTRLTIRFPDIRERA